MTFCETFPPDHFPIYFYREPKAPDLEIYPDELDFDAITARAALLGVTGWTLQRAESLGDDGGARGARSTSTRRSSTSTIRPSFWTSREDARDEAHSRRSRHATIAVGNLGEVEVAVGSGGPDVAADRLLDARLCRLAVVKLGPEGCSPRRATNESRSRRSPVDVVNGLGAGDGFGGALCHGVLSGWTLDETIRFASAAGAIVASRLSCSEAMPTNEEVRELLEGVRP